MPKKKTQQEFKLEVQLNHPNIIVSGEYINAKTNVHCKCKICNYEWNTTPDNLHSGKGCPQCGGTLKLSQEDFILRIKKLHNNVTILSKYKNAKSKVFCKCNICNYEWHPIASDLLHGSNCPNCAGNMTKETQNFIDELKNINPNVKIIGKYINNKTKILCNCNLCHQNFDTSPSNLLKGCYHEECAHKIGADKQRKSQMDFENDVHNIFPDLKVLGEYKNNSSRIKVKCEKCNHEWSPYASNLMSGCGCPKCASSKGEKSISKFFDDHKIDYQTQYRINECRNKNPLPFDFAVFDRTTDFTGHFGNFCM